MNAIQIESDGDFGFTTRTVARDEAQADVSTYAFASGMYFARVTNLNGLAERLFRDRDLTQMDPSMLLSTLFQSNRQGFARVDLIASDVLVIESVAGPAMVLTRCLD
jgi:hypothetical protein